MEKKNYQKGNDKQDGRYGPHPENAVPDMDLTAAGIITSEMDFLFLNEFFIFGPTQIRKDLLVFR